MLRRCLKVKIHESSACGLQSLHLGSSLIRYPHTGSSTTSNSTATAARPTNTNLAGTVIQVGPYECTRSVNLDLVLDILSSHLDNTQTNVNATIKYLVLSLHEAVIPGTNPGSLSGDQLPHGDSLLSTIITSAATNLSNYLYSPDDLGDQRADLNASFSWFAVNPSKEPSPSYFTVDESNRKSFTPNGWPAESFVEMTQAKRLIVAAGDGGFQLQDYNNTTDAASIFASSYLEDRVSVGLAPNGDIISGCLFDPATTTIGAPNNSWASFGISMKSLTDVQAYMNAADSLTRCGISSDLNTTLGGVTADADYQPYHQFAQSTIWSWAPDEPVNNTAPGSDAPSISNRCAVLNATSGYWQAEDCGTPHFSACRSFGQPYKWSIGGADTTYDKAELGCKEGTEFDTPRTALENRHLLHTWRSTLASRDTDGDKLLWVNFNDLDAKACWVIGQNATCPYLNDTDRERVIIVPVVAAVVVFVLAALTVFVKCASNRQNTKRRRKRGDDGWDYEGVPS